MICYLYFKSFILPKFKWFLIIIFYFFNHLNFFSFEQLRMFLRKTLDCIDTHTILFCMECSVCFQNLNNCVCSYGKHLTALLRTILFCTVYGKCPLNLDFAGILNIFLGLCYVHRYFEFPLSRCWTVTLFTRFFNALVCARAVT